MNVQTIRSIIEKRATVDDEWQQGIELCWEELTSALTEDYVIARAFLLEECSADEASWVSEVYDDIILKTQSRDYINLLRECIGRFPEEDKCYHMSEQLDSAVASCYIERSGV